MSNGFWGISVDGGVGRLSIGVVQRKLEASQSGLPNWNDVCFHLFDF